MDLLIREYLIGFCEVYAAFLKKNILYGSDVFVIYTS